MRELINNVSALCSAAFKYVNKRTSQAGALMLALVLLFTGAINYAPVEDTTYVDNDPARTAGFVSTVADLELEVAATDVAYLRTADVSVVAAISDEVEADETDEYDEWSDKVIADVNEYLYIRADEDANSEIVGKLRKGDVATLISVADGWYEIESGNAQGFVSSEYCVTGIEAYELALEVCDTYATTGVAGLRIRKEPATDAKILKTVSKGTKLIVRSDVETIDGWVAVSAAGTEGFVSAEFVDVNMETGEAITLEEEAEAKRIAEEKARKAREAAEAAAAANKAIIDSADDVTLLAAIIQIESGNQPYEGQVGVGAVVMNRVRSGHYPNSVGGVIFARGQFATGRMSKVIAKGPKASCIQAAQDAINGVDTTGGATHFRRAGSRSGLVIGGHVFY